MLGYLVHTLGAYLHLHPLVLRAKNRDVQTLIAVGFGHAQPVSQALGVGLVHVCHDGVDLPALHLLFLEGRVEDNADGKQVIDALEAALLLLHLLPDGVDALGSSLHVKL